MPGVGASNVETTVLNSAITTAEIAATTTIAGSYGQLNTTQGLRIRGVLNFTTAATGTGFTIRCRQGSGTGGATVSGGLLTHNMANSTTQSVPFDFLDIAPVAGNNIYTITLAALTVAGTLNAITAGVEVGDQYMVGTE